MAEDKSKPSNTGKFFLSLRKDRKLTQKEVGDKTGLNQRELSLLENGQRSLSPKIISVFLKFYCKYKEPIHSEEWAGLVCAYLLDLFNPLYPDIILEVLQKQKTSEFSSFSDWLLRTSDGDAVVVSISGGKNADNIHRENQQVLTKIRSTELFQAISLAFNMPPVLDIIKRAVEMDQQKLKLLNLYVDQLYITQEKMPPPFNG